MKLHEIVAWVRAFIWEFAIFRAVPYSPATWPDPSLNILPDPAGWTIEEARQSCVCEDKDELFKPLSTLCYGCSLQAAIRYRQTWDSFLSETEATDAA